jgi:putative component of membrane protein insertase Oxa1/YidC/SpoIIIJ protein YidD
MSEKSNFNLIKQAFFGFFHILYRIGRYIWTLFGGPKQVCPFYPTCGEYVKICFTTLPLHKALFYSFKRVLSCHPWREGTIDQPPKR